MRARDASGDVVPELAAELLARGHRVVLRARGTSMAPLLRDGDRLTLAPLARPPRAGDVVAALRQSRLFVHRVIQVRGEAATLQGDALWQSDPGSALWQSGVGDAISPSDESTDSSAARIIGRAESIRRGDRELGSWRLSGSLAFAWIQLAPLVRLIRGALRHAARRTSPVR